MSFATLLFAVSLSASGNVGPDPVRLLFLDASACKFAIMQASLAPHTPAEIAQFDSDRAKARADMDRHSTEATQYPGQSADLNTEIKAFHDAAVAYCVSPSSATEDDYKAKKRALDNRLTGLGR